MNSLLKCTGILALPVLGLMLASPASSAQQWIGNPATGAELYDACVPCHTLQGKGIAGLKEDVLIGKMKEYQAGTYADPKIQGMQKVLQSMSDQQLFDLAAYITKM